MDSVKEIERLAKYLSAMYVISETLETYSLDLFDEMKASKYKEPRIYANNVRNDMQGIKRAHAQFRKKILPLIQEEQTKFDFFGDCERFKAMVDEFTKL